MYFPHTEYSKSVKLSTRCYIEEVIKTFDKLDLTKTERAWFNNHEQFCHIFHMPKDGNHKVQPMWMLLLRTAQIEKKNEAWFIVNGVPIRYGLREHALLSGLDCRNYPLNWREAGSLDFVKRHFKKRVTMQGVKEKLEKMGPDRNGERLKMAVLYFLCSIVYSPVKQGPRAAPVLDIFQRLVNDLKLCETFPWGKLSFELILQSIKDTVDHFDGKVGGNWAFPGFCVPLEILAVESIPVLRDSFRVENPQACHACPRMCKYKWKKSDQRGFPLETVYEKLGDTTDIDSLLVIATEEEQELLDECTEEPDNVDVHDVVVESWMKRLEEGLDVHFDDMLADDLKGRASEMAVNAGTSAGTSARARKSAGKSACAGEGGNELAQLLDAVKDIGQQLNGVVVKVDDLGKRMQTVEDYVKEQKASREK